MKKLIHYLLVFTLVAPPTWAQEGVDAMGDESVEFEEEQDQMLARRTPVYDRILAFIDRYHIIKGRSTDVPEIERLDSYEELLAAWQNADVQKQMGPETNEERLLLARGTAEDKELFREAEKIAYDMTRLNRPAAIRDFYATLINMFALEVQYNETREPLKMIWDALKRVKFTPEYRAEIEDNVSFLSNISDGFVVGTLFAAGYFIAVPSNKKVQIASGLRNKVSGVTSTLKGWYNRLRGRTPEPEKPHLALPHLRREDTPDAPDLTRRLETINDGSIPANRSLVPTGRRSDWIPNRGYDDEGVDALKAIGGALDRSANYLRDSGRRAFNVTKSLLLDRVGELSGKQILGLISAYSMGAAAMGSVLGGVRTMAYRVGTFQYETFPEDELSKHVRPYEVLKLQCDAEAFALEVEQLRNYRGEEGKSALRADARFLRTLINEYQFLKGLGYIYFDPENPASAPNAEMPLPESIYPDPDSGQVYLYRNYLGQDLILSMSCPTRKGQEITGVSLDRARETLDQIRTELMIRDRVIQTTEVETQAGVANIAEKIMNAEAKEYNAIVETLMTNYTDGDMKAGWVLRRVADMLKNANPLVYTDLSERIDPEDVLRGRRFYVPINPPAQQAPAAYQTHPEF